MKSGENMYHSVYIIFNSIMQVMKFARVVVIERKTHSLLAREQVFNGCIFKKSTDDLNKNDNVIIVAY